ncbi:AcrR family transcriptional regulator [Paenarthrobacter nicotinovorans]|uniref:TetR/AcrR family transcriptional regulator n=1 Tax=Micrococcaceae TaxID=1268 RepID=UPI0008773600|nr:MULTISPECIES: TetR family transcriptional regulator [Micrococcaceae]MDR6438541.1 AcrR family transcriptional regulator [Paenarthrobacter nicotinovorans]SCZ59982.1 transcriptional regulator, TetR family [Arthrobacter sp. UNCCL28]
MSQEARKLPYGDGRDALLSAVLDVVAEKGLRGASYRSVAARAGVNHALITHHFGSMEGLLAATMEWSVQRSIQETGLSGLAEPDGNFADSLIATVSAEPELQLFQFEMVLESRRNPQIRTLVERLYASYVSTVEEALTRRGLDTGNEAALAIFAALDGLMLQFVTMSDPARIRAAVHQVARLITALEPANGATGTPGTN